MKLTKQEKIKLNKIRIELFELLMIELKINIKYELRNDRKSSIYLLDDICQMSKCYIDKDIDTYIVGMINPESLLSLIKMNQQTNLIHSANSDANNIYISETINQSIEKMKADISNSINVINNNMNNSNNK